MKYRRLGRTDLRVSVVGVGTWQFGGEWGQQFSQPEVDRVLGRAAELGINLIDTAECYGDHLSESLIGQSIRGQRNRWILATKFGHRFTGHLQRDQLWSAEDVRQQLERSLRALQVDTIDLYQFHSGSNAQFDNDALWTMLDKQVRAGAIRHLGISVSSRSDPMYQVNRATAVGAGVIQVVYNRLQREPEEQLLPACEAYDLGVLARVPLASGLLSGKYGPSTRFTGKDDVRSSFQDQAVQDQLREVQQIQKTEVPAGVPMAPWALAWCLRQPAVTCVIPGCKSVAQVESNAAAAELANGDHPQAVA
jgi:aryl-alcohol dehydrogenase-like predicted oxidoreductase